MGERKDLLFDYHKNSHRDYLSRVNNVYMPKYVAAQKAKTYGFEYWDGDRSINYGGYFYREGYWDSFACKLINTYRLNSQSKILEVGCGKGFLLFDIIKHCPGIDVVGLDISSYAIGKAPNQVSDCLIVGDAKSLPFEADSFDLVISINTLHNLLVFDLVSALREIERVGTGNAFVNVESYSSELQKQNLLYWQVTCEAFFNPEEWVYLFKLAGYSGDYGFIFFD